jgi:hypothetical protein
MDLQEAATLVHFRELHFLPRVIFSIGAILFIGSFFVKEELLGLFGIGVIFFASTLNLFVNICLRIDVSITRKAFSIPWALLFQGILSGVLCWYCLSISRHMFLYNSLPSYLQAH